jgi:hypothetical protein
MWRGSGSCSFTGPRPPPPTEEMRGPLLAGLLVGGQYQGRDVGLSQLCQQQALNFSLSSSSWVFLTAKSEVEFSSLFLCHESIKQI